MQLIDDSTEVPHPPAPAAEVRFRAMGTTCHVIVVGAAPGAIRSAVARVTELEHRWSRFRADSEVIALHRDAGRWVEVSDDTVELVSRGIDAWRLTGGRFDPTVLGDVVRAGYAASFEGMGDAATGRPAAGGLAVQGCDGIEVRPGAVRLPAGCGFDPGGLGKGLAADLVVARLADAGAAGACVNLGGDVRVFGRPPDDVSWGVDVRHELSPEPLTRLAVAAGAVATSTTLRRRWVVDGAVRHHVIDPRSGRSAATDLDTVTVLAGHGWSAEVLATAALVAGRAEAIELVEAAGAAAVTVGVDGTVERSAGVAPFLATELADRVPSGGAS